MDKVIIDGVDVSECEHYRAKLKYKLPFDDYTVEQDKCHYSGIEIIQNCKGNKGCIYKQLQRAKAELKKYEDMAKKGLEEFKDIGGCWGCGLQLQLNQDIEDIKQLKAENERLKEEIKEVKKYQYEQEYLEKEIETVKVNLDIGKEEAKHYLHEAYKFQKCLQEIRDIVTLFHSVNEDKGLNRFKNNILAKINEVIGAE